MYTKHIKAFAKGKCTLAELAEKLKVQPHRAMELYQEYVLTQKGGEYVYGK